MRRLRKALPPAATPFQVYVRLHSVDQARNRDRDYALAWQPALVGDGALIRTRGRANGTTQTRVDYYSDRAAAQARVEEILLRRLRHGYRILAWQ